MARNELILRPEYRPDGLASTLLRSAPDEALYRINPIQFANEKSVQATLEMREAVDELNRDRSQRDFILKIGMHRGAPFAVTLNERLDYFGQTVNIAARVQNHADGDEICITEDVYRAPDAAEIVAPYPVTRSEAELKGVSKAMVSRRLECRRAHHPCSAERNSR